MGNLLGVDVASYQGKYNVNGSAAGRVPDFVIAKATGGTSYVSPVCDYVIQQCLKSGKLFGFYHYFTGSGYKAEVDFFIKNTWSGYGRKGLPCFDWESGSNSAWGNGAYLKNASDYFHDKTGVWPVIYTTAAVAKSQLASTGIFKNCALWCAGYPYNNGSWSVPNFMYSLPAGVNMIIWQFDSAGGYDKNIAYIDKATWAKYVNPSGAAVPKPSTPKQAAKPAANAAYSTSGKSLEAMASDVVAGKVGSGAARQKALGNYATAVQAIVNERLKAVSASACHNTLKAEVLNGHLGNGDTRKRLLGSYYNTVQGLINGASAPKARTYKVKSGDTLSGIGAKLGINWQTIATKNGIRAPYVIYAGQALKY